MWFSGLFGVGQVRFYGAPRSVLLSKKSHAVQSMVELAKSIVPPCRLNPFLFNGHLHTFWSLLHLWDAAVYYKRKVFEADDADFAGSFTVDFVVPEHPDVDETLPPRTIYYSQDELDGMHSLDSRPMLITLHGLSGGSHELYVRQVLQPLTEYGWEACVINARGCAMSALTGSVLYNARATWDIRQVVKWCRRTFPNRPLFAIGYSIGGNVLTNYVGEEGEDCILKAAVVLSSPYNLEICNHMLKMSWMGREVYSRAMGAAMIGLVKRHTEQLSQHPNINVEEIIKAKYLYEFDRMLQGPTWGYPTEEAYYRDASSSDALLAVRIPLFALHAADDPVTSQHAVPYEEFRKNPFTLLCMTSAGGHLGWSQFGGKKWFVKPVVNFLQTMAKEVEHVQMNPDLEELLMETIPQGYGNPTFQPMRRTLRYQLDHQSLKRIPKLSDFQKS